MSIPSDSPALPLNIGTAEKVGQSGSVGERKVNPAQGRPEANPQSSLNEHQQVLKDKSGLNERVCANFDTENEGVQTFVNNLQDGKFSPNIFKKFVLWLSSKLGGPDYEVAVRQFRIETAATKNQELFKNQEFQESLATAIKSCDGSELPRVLSVAHDLLSADPDARRDFFINKLLIPCLNEAHEEISKDEPDIKNSIEKYKKYSPINQFCGNKKIEHSKEEQKQVNRLKPTQEDFSLLLTDAMYHIISSSGSERDSCSQNLEEVRSLSSSQNLGCELFFEIFDEMKGDFISILQCFGKTQNEQVKNFKALVEGLKTVSKEARKEGGDNLEQIEERFKEKTNEFFSKNPKLMWAALKMLKTNEEFSGTLFFEAINFQGGGEDKNKIFSSVALQTIQKGGHKNLSDEQVLPLCGGVEFLDLPLDEKAVEENKDTIHMVLKFIQDRALASTDPKISFGDHTCRYRQANSPTIGGIC